MGFQWFSSVRELREPIIVVNISNFQPYILPHRWLTTHLEGDSRSGLEQLLGNQDPIAIESTEYNWNLNKLWAICERNY
jgi:hypothetical protein